MAAARSSPPTSTPAIVVPDARRGSETREQGGSRDASTRTSAARGRLDAPGIRGQPAGASSEERSSRRRTRVKERVAEADHRVLASRRSYSPSEDEELDAAGDVELDPRDVRGEVRAEERDRVRDVLRLPGRLKTVRFAIRSFMAGFAMWKASVPMIPGTIALQVIPCRPPSIASVRVRPRIPDFVVE